MVVTVEQLFTAFRDWLTGNHGLTWNSPRGNWTGSIKGFFDNLGSEEGFEVVFTRRGVPEYLLDLIWILRSPKRFIQLGLESEMSENRSRCIRAFEKLTDTKAYYKIGIFRLSSSMVENSLFQEFRQILNDHDIPIGKERYFVIFLSYNSTQSRIKVTGYLVQPDSSHEKLLDDNPLFPES